ncbi:MAG: hypothetical protein AAGK78_14450, partial [Planctomycetota bacterium]
MSNQRATLALALIVRDGEPVLRHLIEAVGDRFPLIAGVDDASTDGGLALARDHGTAIEFHWQNDLAAARNVVWDLAEAQRIANWLLWIDSDERLAQIGDSVEERLATSPMPAARVLRVESANASDESAARATHVRAYRCDSGLRCAGRYHEFPVDEALQVACRQGVELPTVDVTLTHLPPSPAVMREKLRRNARL